MKAFYFLIIVRFRKLKLVRRSEKVIETFPVCKASFEVWLRRSCEQVAELPRQKAAWITKIR